MTTNPDALAALRRDDFLSGVCVALACVKSMDCGVTWREIVKTAGVDDLFQYAAFVEPDEWELAGFARYALAQFKRRKPQTSHATLTHAPAPSASGLADGYADLRKAALDASGVPLHHHLFEIRALLAERDQLAKATGATHA